MVKEYFNLQIRIAMKADGFKENNTEKDCIVLIRDKYSKGNGEKVNKLQNQ